MNNRGQTGLEYLLLLGGVILLIAVAIVVMTSLGEAGKNRVNEGGELFEEDLDTLLGPMARFTASPVSFSVNCESVSAEVTFTNKSERANSYEWNYGDGSPISIAFEETHNYTSCGEFRVELTAWHTDDSSRTHTAMKLITVAP